MTAESKAAVDRPAEMGAESITVGVGAAVGVAIGAAVGAAVGAAAVVAETPETPETETAKPAEAAAVLKDCINPPLPASFKKVVNVLSRLLAVEASAVPV